MTVLTAPSLPVVVPALADTCIIINGVAKTYAMTGWRVGWMIGPKDVIKAATNLQSHLSSNVSNVSQRAAIAALTGNLDAVHTMGEAFNRRRKLIVDLLNEIPGFECPTPTGAFYVYPSVKGVLGKTIRGKTPNNICRISNTCYLKRLKLQPFQAKHLVPLDTYVFHMQQVMKTLLKVLAVLRSCLQKVKSQSQSDLPLLQGLFQISL